MKLINQFKLEFKSIANNVAFARMVVATFASQLNYTLNDLEEIKVAVSEAVTNAIVHGYAHDPEQNIALTVVLADTGMEIKVADLGCGIEDIKQAMQPTYSTAPERMGLGFVFMQSFMDKLQVDSTPGAGTTIIMFKKINTVPDQPEH
ncbi:anti-sigma F factor [Peptococcaceae bacterium]|nr:anti-sigma F factor [Peptococcaceae bacterium]